LINLELKTLWEKFLGERPPHIFKNCRNPHKKAQEEEIESENPEIYANIIQTLVDSQ
jgi:hypothetical protein